MIRLKSKTLSKMRTMFAIVNGYWIHHPTMATLPRTLITMAKSSYRLLNGKNSIGTRRQKKSARPNQNGKIYMLANIHPPMTKITLRHPTGKEANKKTANVKLKKGRSIACSKQRNTTKSRVKEIYFTNDFITSFCLDHLLRMYLNNLALIK